MTPASSEPPTELRAGTGEMEARIGGFDWTRTPLGAIEAWPQSLKTSVSLILNCPHPMWIGWGPEMTFLYNDAYSQLLGPAQHPGALGKPACEVWAEGWDVCGPIARKVLESGEPAVVSELPLLTQSGDLWEEKLYSFSCSAIRDESGRIAGLFCPSTHVRRLSLNGPGPGARPEVAKTRDEVIDLLENMRDGFVALDSGWRIAYINAEAERLTGMRRDDMLGRNYWELFPASVGTILQSEFMRAAKEGVPVEFDNYYAPWKRWFHVKAYPASDGGLSAFYEDITPREAAEEARAALLQREREAREQAEQEMAQREQVEQALRESGRRFREMIDALPAAIYTTDAHGRLTHFNPEAVKLSGRVPELGTDQWCVTWKLFKADGTPLAHDECPMAITLKEGRSVSGPECIAERPDGTRFWFTAYPTCVRDDEGRVAGGINMLVDITDRKATEEALRRSEERFRGVFDSSAIGVAVLTLDAHFLMANKAFCSITGYSEGEFQALTCSELTHPADRAAMDDLLGQLLRGQIPTFVIEQRYLAKDGRTIWVQNSVSVMRDAAGQPEHLIALCEDVTARKHAERATLHLSAIVDSSDDAIVSKDLSGIVTSWNKGAERLFGYTAEEAIGQSITLIIPAERLSEEPEILRHLQRGERVDHFETIRRRKDGSLLDISLTISPVKDKNGKIIGASKIARDITERRRAEEAIRALNAQLTSELVVMTRMQQLSIRLAQADEFPVLLDEIVEAGVELTRADMGNIQLFEDGVLKIVSQRGFDNAFLEYFNRVEHGVAACGTALRKGERVVIEDVATSPIFAGTPELEVMLAASARAVQSTPLISRSGQVLGVFSTHYRSPHRPNDRALRMLDVLARQAADLIERKRAEAALLASEGRFRQLADSMPQIVWTARPDGYFDYFNDRWYQYTGFGRDVFGDSGWESLVHPDDLKRCHDSWYRSVSTGEPYRIEYRFWDRHEKRWRWFMGRALPARDDEGIIVKWFGSCTDIDEQKRVEDDLRHANQDLEQFAYSASHDLQEPLRGIKIYSELLMRRYSTKLEGQALEFLNYVRGNASRMEMLLRDLLAYTQITKLDGPDESADANEALQGTLANLEGAVVESGARITWDALPSVRIHDAHLKQLFQNLVGNAIKYRSPERTPAIHVSAEKQDGHWLFSVADNGIGIEPQYKERIFGLFKRLHKGDEYAGTGIGLAICQRIVDRYQGRIWVESAIERGSTFKFTLPC